MAEDIIWGYQRVADGDACEFCAMIDGAQFRTEDPMPIHPNCGCGVEPVEYTRLTRTPTQTRSVPKQLQGDAIPDEVLNASDASSATRDAVTQGAAQLDDAIKIRTKPTTLKFEPLDPGTAGQMAARSKTLSITTNADVPANAIPSIYHHEFGHLIDYFKVPAGSPEYFAAQKARKELVKIIRRTNAVKELRAISKTARGGNKSYLTYLLSENELIARAFQAWMAAQSPQAKASSRALWALTPDGETNKRIARAMAFDDDDLGPIDTAVRKWLVAKGFL